ncbi:SemiSWEET transporter [Parachitinimonas caeni]|uniref:SemiSWEET transporter n=1 Tax=Parachitinimonas caeni TaxID=3031301 RepID=A0ABT7DW78_9NEIS|nr:SemiSWEET transporter [Parachitinimonas caeni]MDK2124305.1 SemiSWEET transporter [Parachitinimonas caeni]
MTLSLEWIGMLAGFLTTFAFVPQVIRVYRTRSTHDISLPMYSIFVTGVGLWLYYGWLIGSRPIVLFNAITFVLAGAVLVMKLRFR